MVAQIVNSNNGVNSTVNTLASQRNPMATVENQIVNENNGTNDSTNIIHNQAETIYATNQIINVYDGPDPSCSLPPSGGFPSSCPGPWSPSPPCSPWWCYNPWPCCFGMGGFFPYFATMAALPLLLFYF